VLCADGDEYDIAQIRYAVEVADGQEINHWFGRCTYPQTVDMMPVVSEETMIIFDGAEET
jgi:hypothetical protein